MINPHSFLFITLDSCRFDTFKNSKIPNMKRIGTLYEAKSPSNFSFGSHASMFVGFTPGIPKVNESYLNPKFGKIFKMVNGGFAGKGTEFLKLEGENIIQGFNRLEYITIGTGAVGWFDPNTETGRVLSKDFQHFFFPGNSYSVEKQIEWLNSKILQFQNDLLFVFINIGETHVPYYYNGAPWSKDENPCIPFSENNDAEQCRYRQTKCLEFVDKKIGPLLEQFSDASILICADHGDCWGEDGLWEHGIHHDMVLTVPIIMRLHSKSI